MNSSGRFSLILVSVFAMVWAGLFLGATDASGLRASDNYKFESYTSFPTAGGPYIIAATWDDANNELRVIFNEPLTAATVCPSDFLAIGGWVLNDATSASTVEVIPHANDRRVVTLTNFTTEPDPAAGTDSIAIRTIGDFALPACYQGGITGLDAVVCTDHSHVPIVTGPVAVQVILNTWLEGNASNDQIQVVFDADIDAGIPAGNATGAKFLRTPELEAIGASWSTALTLDVARNGADNNVLDIDIAAAGSVAEIRQLWPGIAKLWMGDDAVEWNGTSVGNVAQKVMFDNLGDHYFSGGANGWNEGGPILLGATWIEADDQMWLIFSEPVDPTSLAQHGGLGEVEAQYELGTGVTGWALNAMNPSQFIDATQGLAWPGEFTNVVIITDPTNGASNSTIRVASTATAMTDFQGMRGPQSEWVDIVPGIAIVRAFYDDMNTSVVSDDVLEMWLTEDIATPANVDHTCFKFANNADLPNSIWSSLSFAADNDDGRGRVRVTGWDLPEELLDLAHATQKRLPLGTYVSLSGAALTGAKSGGTNTTAEIPVIEQPVWPNQPLGAEVPAHTNTFFWDPDGTCQPNYTGDEVNEVYLAWHERVSYKVDSWLLYFTASGVSAFDADGYVNDFAGRALNVSNLVSDSLETNGLHRVAVNIVGHGGAAADVFPTDDPGTALVDGDEVWFMLIPVNYWGDIGPRASAIVFSSRFVGGVCPPRDYSDDDDNLIHVAATWTDTNLDGIRQDSEWTRTVTGDAGAALCGTHIYVFSVPDSTTAATAAEVAVIAADGSFGPVDLENNFNAEPYLYLFAKLDDIYSVGASTGGSVHIINDIVAPSLTVDGTGALVNADRFNNFQVYTKNNYLNILALAKDGTPAAAGALSDLLTIMADFTEVDSATTPTTAQGDLVSAVPLVGLGGDQVDNDGDWVAHDLGIDLNDDGVRDYPEPYFDENGDGLFTPGETFFDRDGDLKCDSPRTGVVPGAEGDADIVYDLNLDSADPDERGWYEVQQWSSAPDSSNCHVTKGFKLRYPITDANLVTNFGEIDDAPVNITVWDSTFAVGLTYADTSTASPAIGAAFKCRIDEVPPTISKLTELFVESSLTASTSTAANLILPTGPTYHLGCYVDFTVETDSDDDCLFGVTQVYTNRTGAWSWEGMTLDPPGVNATAGVPGIIYGGIETGASYATPRNGDDDRDATGLNTDGLDNDEDGDIDEAGEGIDLQDIEVVDAVQDSTTNATAGVDLLWRQTDRRDNDGDAFFRFEPFYDVGGTNPGDGSIQPRMIWYNIDESVTNDIDDDGDGTVDEATEIETYSAAYDDNEDGIMDGEAVEITAVASRKYTVAGAGNFWVTKSAVLGEHPANTVGDICALTEIVEGCYGVLDPNGVENTGTFPTLGWGDDSVTDLFNWAALHSVENIDFYLISQLYGMTADGTTEYQLRMLAYDKAGQTTPGYAYPITFTLDVEPPDPQILAITGACDDDPATAPPDFADVDTDRGGLQVYDSGSYTLTVTDDPDAVKVYFTSRFSTTNGATWSSWSTTAIVGTGIDESRPFTGEYDWWLTHSINNDPAADSLAVEFRAIAEDAFGNTQNADSVCVLDVTVIDGTAPHTWFTMINTVENAYWATYGGASATTVFPYWYRDHYGPVRVPAGPVINIWAEFDDNDDSVPFDATNDVIRLVFEARAVGAGGEWTPIETVTGGIDPASGDSLTIDGTRPVAVTLDTQTMGTGSYDIRVWACDIEGNCSTLSADMATITIVEEGLRAYIEPPYHDPATGAGTFELYAFNYIHDAELDFVEFQFYEDTDGDGVDNDSHSWHKIAIDGDDTGRGDVLLRRGSHKYYDLSGHIAFVNGGGASGDEVFIDFDEDGYSMRDPVIMEQAGGAWGQYDHGIDIVVVGELTGTYDGHATTNFAATEFHTGDAPFDPTEWIMKDNGLEGGVALELWHTQWD
ncbi:MAG: hypothetical protein KAY24_04420, partial [Candidatus Eisenbacteria sp.]|nr:hypothetical protein [Candidatus Eisenbacteria bacterium]